MANQTISERCLTALLLFDSSISLVLVNYNGSHDAERKGVWRPCPGQRPPLCTNGCGGISVICLRPHDAMGAIRGFHTIRVSRRKVWNFRSWNLVAGGRLLLQASHFALLLYLRLAGSPVAFPEQLVVQVVFGRASQVIIADNAKLRTIWLG